MKKLTKTEVKELIEGKLATHFGTSADQATPELIYQCVALIVRDILQKKSSSYQEQVKKAGGKTVYYLCMEFLFAEELGVEIEKNGPYSALRQCMQRCINKWESSWQY